MAKSKYTPDQKSASFKLGPIALAATGAVGLALIVALCLLVPLFLAFITMILLGVLHAEVALGIPAFGYWASFWLTVAWIYVSSFFRSSSN